MHGCTCGHADYWHRQVKPLTASLVVCFCMVPWLLGQGSIWLGLVFPRGFKYTLAWPECFAELQYWCMRSRPGTCLLLLTQRYLRQGTELSLARRAARRLLLRNQPLRAASGQGNCSSRLG